jgi:hypothetical protein
MKVTIYFVHEPTGFTLKVANFLSEEIYMKCFPQLEAIAKEGDMVISESVNYDEEDA